MFNTQNDLITVEELQELLDIGKNTAYTLLKENKIKSFKIGRNWKIPRKSVDAYITEQINANDKK